VSALLVAFWLFIAVFSVLKETPLDSESVILMVFILMFTTDVGVAWWRADLGGFSLLTTALGGGVFAYLAAGHNKGLAVAVTAGPVFVVGLLFLAAWQYSGSRKGV